MQYPETIMANILRLLTSNPEKLLTVLSEKNQKNPDDFPGFNVFFCLKTSDQQPPAAATGC